MAVIGMRKIKLVGHSREKQKLLVVLHRTGSVEIIKSVQLDETIEHIDIIRKEEINTKITRLNAVMKFMREQMAFVKAHDKKDEVFDTLSLPTMFKPEEPVGYKEFSSISTKEYELFSTISELEIYSERQNDIRSMRQKYMVRIEQLLPFSQMEVPFSELQDTKNTRTIIGTLQASKLKEFNKIIEDFPNAEIKIYCDKQIVGAVIISHNEEISTILDSLTAVDFLRVNYDYDTLTSETISNNILKVNKLKFEELQIATKATEMFSLSRDFRILSEYYTLALDMVKASDGYACTDYAYIMEGWVPVTKMDIVSKAIKDSGIICEVNFSLPEPTDEVPTYLENNKIASNYENITEMYSTPNYKEPDPNAIMSIFYFIFFGIMVSDAGYGLLLMLGTTIALKYMGLAPNSQKMCRVIFMGGFSTFLWGIIFGSVFGLPDILPWKLFSPLDGDGPLILLGVALTLGIVQIVTGLLFKAIFLIKNGHFIDALCDQLSWVMIIFGLVCYVVSSLFAISSLAFLSSVGLYLVLTGLAILLLTAGRKKKSVFGKIIGGLGGLYGIINYMGDIMSYARLFGLGLATGAIAMVINKMAGIMVELLPGVGFVVAALVLVVGHLFNLGINTLGAYVHNNRLQFVEFYSKFYEGQGRAFAPLGANLGKKINIKQ